MLFHNVASLRCHLNTPYRYIFQLFSTTCLLGWRSVGVGVGVGGARNVALFVIEARPGPVCLQGRPELPHSLRECVRVCERGGDGVSRGSRGQEIDGNHGNLHTRPRYPLQLTTLSLSTARAPHPGRCRASLCDKNNSQYRI